MHKALKSLKMLHDMDSWIQTEWNSLNDHCVPFSSLCRRLFIFFLLFSFRCFLSGVWKQIGDHAKLYVAWDFILTVPWATNYMKWRKNYITYRQHWKWPTVVFLLLFACIFVLDFFRLQSMYVLLCSLLVNWERARKRKMQLELHFRNAREWRQKKKIEPGYRCV